jgi:hypothetical protein
MEPEHRNNPEIESFNLTDLDITALDTRLELTTILPQYIYCDGYCGANISCGINSGCVCDSYN